MGISDGVEKVDDSRSIADGFKVGYTRDFLKSDGSLAYQSIGTEALLENADVIVTDFLSTHEPVLGPKMLSKYNAIVALTPRIDRDSLAEADDLLAILRFGVGYDTVDVGACTDAGVALCIARGAVDHSVAEAVVGWLLQLGHRSTIKDQLVRKGRWADRVNYMGRELRGSVLGIIGFGGIGLKVAELARAFGVAKILIFDPYLQKDRAGSLGIEAVGLDQLLHDSDYVSINCPLNDGTRNLIGQREIALMKPTAFLVNTARGGIVCENALLAALKHGGIAGAALDVFENEPISASSPFAELDNVILAPHCISWTDNLYMEIGRKVSGQIIEFASGNIPDDIVNPEVLQHPKFQQKMSVRKHATTFEGGRL
jgi:phosphoglycerate dehydrogenase-like enzyme